MTSCFNPICFYCSQSPGMTRESAAAKRTWYGTSWTGNAGTRNGTARRRVSGTGKTIILISYRVVRVPALRGEIMNERFSPFCVVCVSWKRKVTVRLRCRLDFGNKRARGEDAYCFDWHGKGRFSPFLLLGQEAWKKRIFQRDYKGKNYNAIRNRFQLVCAKNLRLRASAQVFHG